jgi:hypothetical protein
MTFAIRIDQQHYYEQKLECLRQKRPLPADSSLIHQTPFLDIHSIMRVGGRLDKSAFNEDMKHPIILHQSSNFARLIIQERHVFLAHGRPDPRSWQVKISFPALKFLFLFPPQNLIVLSGVLGFFSCVLFLSVSSLCLFSTFFFTFPIFAAIFCFFFVIFATFPSSTHFPRTFPLQSLFDRLENGLATSV